MPARALLPARPRQRVTTGTPPCCCQCGPARDPWRNSPRQTCVPLTPRKIPALCRGASTPSPPVSPGHSRPSPNLRPLASGVCQGSGCQCAPHSWSESPRVRSRSQSESKESLPVSTWPTPGRSSAPTMSRMVRPGGVSGRPPRSSRTARVPSTSRPPRATAAGCQLSACRRVDAVALEGLGCGMG